MRSRYIRTCIPLAEPWTYVRSRSGSSKPQTLVNLDWVGDWWCVSESLGDICPRTPPFRTFKLTAANAVTRQDAWMGDLNSDLRPETANYCFKTAVKQQSERSGLAGVC